MRINHNIAALNTHRQLSFNNAGASKSLEKLSSGLRINRAGDDAAGLAISEKMRGQIRGLDMAQKNSQDAISLIQTAEGALNETHSILQRMRELAAQASNGTNSDDDRNEIQKEINQLTSEINRIGNTTEFNTKKLLNGGGVDPTKNTAVSGNGLTVAPNLTGGTNGTGTGGAATQASTAITFAAVNADATLDDGKNFTVNIGGRELSVVYDSTASASSVSGNTITIKTANNMSDANVASAVASQLNNVISNDENLKGNYTATTAAGVLTVSANAVAYDANGKLTGSITGGSVSAADGATNGLAAGIANTAASGSHATSEIDFANVKAEQLIGSGIVIGDKKIDFFDSANGDYTGSADFAIDLNGARNASQIVDKIVDQMSGAAADIVTADPKGVATYGADNSALDNVFLSKSGDKLVITAQTAGAAANDISIGNNAAVKVSETYGSNKLEGEGVTSAKGLSDGEHKVTISNVAAAVTTVVNTTAATGAATITVDSKAESGNYKIDMSDAANAQLQKFNTTTNAWDNVGATFDATATGEVTVGDITINVTGAYDDDDAITFSVDGNHFEATLTEAGSNQAGTSVRVSNGQSDVTLTTQDGVGEVNVNIGQWDASTFAVGNNISWSFETKAAGQETSGNVGGTFTEKFQIGANHGQSFAMEINDMRSLSLNISGTAAGAAQGAVEGAKFTEIKNVTNGTDNEGAEYALDVSTHESAAAAIEVLDNAIKTVSAQRSQLGAYQNRLEHTINNLGTTAENLTAAESRIRDVDMAKEMMDFTKNNILTQAAQAMLAQANQQPQGVLQLLR